MTANISSYIAAIQSAARGEEVRDSIIGALNAINNAIDSAVIIAVNEALSELENVDDTQY